MGKLNTESNSSNIYLKYYSGTSPEARNAVKEGIIEITNNATKNKDFLADIIVHITKDCKSLPEDSRLCSKTRNLNKRKFIGATDYPILNDEKKEIIIRTGYANIFTKLGLKDEEFSSSDLKNAVLHEIGHLFDGSFGENDTRLLERVKDIDFDNPTAEDYTIFNKFIKTQDLSDSEEFKNAWKNDVEALSKNTDAKKIIKKLRHFAPGSYVNSDSNANNDINIFDGISEEELINADYERSECFAQLFSYTFNSEDSKNNTELIQKTYRNCFEVVKKYISEYLGIPNIEK